MAITTSPEATPSFDEPASARRLLDGIRGDEKHSPAATSTFDVLWVLYNRVLHIDPSRPDDPDRDRFVLSKGHGPQAFYAVLADRGFFPTDWLATYGAFDSPLGHHPDRRLIPGVEVSSGSLGHGLPVTVGMALALRAQQLSGPRFFCLLGDAELDEGSNHEAIALAGRLQLAELSAVVIDNASSTHGWGSSIGSRFEVEGWWTAAVDGRDHAALEDAFTSPTTGRPRAVIATVRDDQ